MINSSVLCIFSKDSLNIASDQDSVKIYTLCVKNLISCLGNSVQVLGIVMIQIILCTFLTPLFGYSHLF